jgi:hypothetical protein
MLSFPRVESISLIGLLLHTQLALHCTEHPSHPIAAVRKEQRGAEMASAKLGCSVAAAATSAAAAAAYLDVTRKTEVNLIHSHSCNQT